MVLVIFLIIVFLVVFVLWFVLREKSSINKHKKNQNYSTKEQREKGKTETSESNK